MRRQGVNDRGEMPESGKVKVPTRSMHHKVMGGKHPGAHPVSEHCPGGTRMTGQSGAKGSPLGVHHRR